MAKSRTAYVCSECGSEHNKWQGQCTDCGAWNSLSEIVLSPAKAAAAPRRGGYAGDASAPRVQSLGEIAQQVEQRIQGWFSSTERYPRQLREMDRTTYVSMKRQEYERQQAVAVR